MLSWLSCQIFPPGCTRSGSLYCQADPFFNPSQSMLAFYTPGESFVAVLSA